MIHVTSGHESSVGLEVFFRSLPLINKKSIDKVILHVSKEVIRKYCHDYQWNYSIKDCGLEIFSLYIKCKWTKDTGKTSSQSSLESALSNIGKKDILLTLPTSKNQLSLKGQACHGYTEYLRRRYQKDNLVMSFKAKNHFFILLSDHIPLNRVSNYLTKEIVKEKIELAKSCLKNRFNHWNDIYLAGINPHAGEGGILGNEEASFEELLIKNPEIKGPLPGDTLHFYFNNQKKQVFIYSFHDQALAIFKEKYGILGSNITLGLDFIRMSVDHGTAFSLYSKSEANIMGCFHLLQEALTLEYQL